MNKLDGPNQKNVHWQHVVVPNFLMSLNRFATVYNSLVAVANKAHKKHPNGKCQLARHEKKFYSSNVVDYLAK